MQLSSLPHREHAPIEALQVEALQGILKEKLIAVVLFGSRARSEAHSFSDWDLFVLAEGMPENPFDRSFFFRERLGGRGLRASVLARTREEFERDLRSLYLDIAHDGIILFDPSGYMSAKLEEIRQITHEAGLYRTKRRGSWVWRWRKQPPLGEWNLQWRTSQ
ncbi:MAG: nucleotidyltransferase domain-containing protein [Deltaproteobacteria bacterium]|nr:nucleotidyltransferase domain-containing protein [Deltaproteobacteria bacterium]